MHVHVHVSSLSALYMCPEQQVEICLLHVYHPSFVVLMNIGTCLLYATERHICYFVAMKL